MDPFSSAFHNAIRYAECYNHIVFPPQGDITKLNTSVLRGIEGGTLHFITVPRSDSQEFIDHVRANNIINAMFI